MVSKQLFFKAFQDFSRDKAKREQQHRPIEAWNNLRKKEAVPWLPTCTESIVTGVHFSEVSVDGGALSRVISTIQTAMTDCVEITAI